MKRADDRRLGCWDAGTEWTRLTSILGSWLRVKSLGKKRLLDLQLDRGKDSHNSTEGRAGARLEEALGDAI